jgi:hypothetical protein
MSSYPFVVMCTIFLTQTNNCGIKHKLCTQTRPNMETTPYEKHTRGKKKRSNHAKIQQNQHSINAAVATTRNLLQTHTHTHTHTHVYVFVCMCIHRQIDIYVHIYIYIYVFICVYIYIHMCVYI